MVFSQEVLRVPSRASETKYRVPRPGAHARFCVDYSAKERWTGRGRDGGGIGDPVDVRPLSEPWCWRSPREPRSEERGQIRGCGRWRPRHGGLPWEGHGHRPSPRHGSAIFRSRVAWEHRRHGRIAGPGDWCVGVSPTLKQYELVAGEDAPEPIAGDGDAAELDRPTSYRVPDSWILGGESSVAVAAGTTGSGSAPRISPRC